MNARSVARWLLPALAVLVWLGVGGATGPLAGKLSQVTTTEASAFLPASAESTVVSEELPAFTDTGYFPAIVVAERDGGLTPADSRYLADATAPLAGTAGFGPDFSPVLPSADGLAAQQFVPIATDGKPKEPVAELRKALDAPPPGLTVAVTGPAAQAADLSGAFAGIDGLLLLVAGTLVLLILIVVYRSPILPIVVLISAILALALASGLVYWLADAGVLELNGQSQGILFILVFGAATDYALLLVARYRETLADQPDARGALLTAWRATLPPIAASAGTVIAGVLCLLLSDLNSNRSLGPIAALGVAASFLASVTFLPAVLALFGRTAFWPRRPQPSDDPGSSHRIWQRVADFVAAAPRKVWAVTLLVLLVGAAFAPMFRSDGVATTDFFLNETESVQGAAVHAEHFDAGSGTPTWIVVPQVSGDAATEVAADTPGVAGAAVLTENGAPMVRDGRVAVQVTLDDDPDSLAAQDTVALLRAELSRLDGARVGGATAVELDTRLTAARDRNLIIPVVLIVVLAILVLLLRSLAAPLLLLVTTVLSFGTTLGIAALMFNGPFGFPGADPTVPLFAFVFLVALGVDYNIFLMTRAREESQVHGTHRGMLIALTSTGGVISAAGIVLAATFSALAVIPLLFLAQIAFLVAVGVLIDTLVVRSLLVPAVTLDVGRRIWWPSALSRSEPARSEPAGSGQS
ncbi:MMPL family transporter [Gordonia alkaliphila]|uniref:MMPL family transporter n=1 Tax=Gordonia alkaliphila TaxID=1053547 RepID=UPI001FF1B1EA|nr:MMPL family transporter [Gordonia alkaliphila]MCK0438844.1 MMPL family transporter [Gordonia alkaliphila]